MQVVGYVPQGVRLQKREQTGTQPLIQKTPLQDGAGFTETDTIKFGTTKPLSPQEVRNKLKHSSEFLTALNERALSLARQADAQQVEPKHFILAMLEPVQRLVQLTPQFVKASPLRVPPEAEDDEGRKVSPQRARTVLDALIPLEVRKQMKEEQIAAVVSRLWQTTDKMVFGKEADFLETDKTGPQTPPMSNALNQILKETVKALIAKPESTAIRELMQLLRTQLALQPDADNRELAALLNSATKKPTTRAVARTPDDFTQLLEEFRKHPKSAMTDEQALGITRLINDFKKAPTSGGDKAKYEARLDVLLNKLNWLYTDTRLNLDAAEAQMNMDHTGLENPKEYILEYVAIQKNREQEKLPEKGKILGMVGPPGVGKTSLAQSLGKALNRPVVRVALGGMRGEEQLRGHRSTFVGALPGRIITALTQAKAMNPIVVLDEIDKVSSDEVQAALLEILDPNQNNSFVDHFIGTEVPIDLSKILFVATANYLEKISPPLQDRMELIWLDGYDESEKLAIAKNHLLPKQAQDKGLKPEQLKLTDAGLQTLINGYTRESGVRKLEQKIGRIAGKLSKLKAKNQPLPAEIGPGEIQALLGPPPIRPTQLKSSNIGVGNGLTVSGDGSGGDVFRFLCKATVLNQVDKNAEPIIEFAPGTPSKNMLSMTNQSIFNALSWITANPQTLQKLGFDVENANGKRIRLTVQTERGTQIDGDSAGAVMTTAMVSALTGRKFRNDVAMTGTILISDEVLAIGGLRQKLRGAKEAGMRVALFPKENLPDYEQLPDRLKAELQLTDITSLKNMLTTDELPKDKMVVVPVDNINDVLDVALLPKEAENAAQVTPPVEPPTNEPAEPSKPVQFSGQRHLTVVA